MKQGDTSLTNSESSLGEGEKTFHLHVLAAFQRQSRVDAPLFDGLPVTVQRLQGVILDPGWHGLYRPQSEGDDEDEEEGWWARA